MVALDDVVSYSQRMEAVLAARDAVMELLSHWQRDRLEAVRSSFEALVGETDTLKRYAENTGRVLLVWNRIVFGHDDHAPEIALDDAVRYTLSEEYWDDAKQGLRLYGTVIGADPPLHLSMTIVQGNGFQRPLPSTAPMVDGSFEIFAPGTQNPDFGMQALFFQQPLLDAFYQLLSQIPLIQWE